MTNAFPKGADAHYANDIVLCLINDGGHGERWIRRLAYTSASLARKAKRGTYDPALAAKAWRYIVDDYAKQEYTPGASVSVATRTLAALLLEQHQREEVYRLAEMPEPSYPEHDAAVTAAEMED